MSARLSWSKNTNSDEIGINDLIRSAVRAEIKCGNNWIGATAALARWLDVSVGMIRARCKDELTGPPRVKRDLIEGCWGFKGDVARRHAAEAARLRDAVSKRDDRLQLELPFDAPTRVISAADTGAEPRAKRA